jgi:hypothetical protein
MDVSMQDDELIIGPHELKKMGLDPVRIMMRSVKTSIWQIFLTAAQSPPLKNLQK